MADQNEQFTPEEINEQTRYISSASHTDADQRLFHDLHRALHDNEHEAKEDARSLQRSWERILSAQQAEHHIQTKLTETESTERKVVPLSTLTKGTGNVPSTRRQAIGRRIGILAAVAVALVLIGSMAYVTQMSRIASTTASNQPNTGPAARGSSSSHGKQGDTATTFQQSDPGVYSVQWSPDGKRIVSTGMSVYSWDAMTGKNAVKYAGLPDPTALIKQGKSKYEVDTLYPAAQWSPDGKSFALPFHSDIQIWDGTTKHLIKTLHYQYSTSNPAEQKIWYVQWSADGKSLKAIVPVADAPQSPTENVVTFNVATGAKTSQVKLAAFGTFNRAAWSPDGNYVAVSYAEDSRVYVLNLHTGQIVYTYIGPSTLVDLTWSPDSKRIATGFGDGKDITQVWDAFTGHNVITHQGGTIPTWSPDGKYIATARMDPSGKVKNDQVLIWNATTGKTVYTYRGIQGSVYTLNWSPDSKYIATAESRDSKTSVVHVWEFQS